MSNKTNLHVVLPDEMVQKIDLLAIILASTRTQVVKDIFEFYFKNVLQASIDDSAFVCSLLDSIKEMKSKAESNPFVSLHNDNEK